MAKYKASNGVYLKRELFLEWNNPDAEFSIRDTGQEEYYEANSGKKYRSLPYLYRQSLDEYECAILMLGSYEHWKKLCACEWFKTGKLNGTQFSGLNDWREEKALADEMSAKKVLMQAIEEGDLQAAKFMYDKSTKAKTATAGKGRPEKKVPSLNKSNVSDIYNEIKKRSSGK
ncbi:MAG: hypothetical protein Unbinned96contig1001_50 [Prokaryotic dsDNA virus sp.]|nr:MAG: hypothetical protein Unbinned96contig1001_50 [Prokaryotic dsDNA virus sp.]|tara:strand:- start:6287 stop:6805 length:519 start_codon:yes stop_codon:yes gene_type:complete